MDADIDGSNLSPSDANLSDADSVDAPPPVSIYCGDRIRDPVTEECDDGSSTSESACTADCRVRDVPVLASDGIDTADASASSRLLGTAPHVAAATDAAFAVLYQESTTDTPALRLQSFAASGDRKDAPLNIASNFAPIASANAAIAPLPQGSFAVAWTDGTDGPPEIRLRAVDGITPGPARLAHSNTTGSHTDPDLIWANGRLIVAWTSLLSVEARVFDADITPLGPEAPLAPSSAIQSGVSLAPFGNGWAAAFRSGDQGLESIVVVSGSTSWTTPPDLPGPVGDRPAVAELDDTHLLLVFAVGTDPAETGAATVGRLRAAVLDVAAPGTVQPFAIGPALAAYASDPSLSQHRPSAARVGDQAYVAWESASPADASSGEQVFVTRVAFDPSATHSLRQDQEMRLPYDTGGGWQSNVHLASSSLFPSGALIAVWETASDGSSRATSDLMLDFRPSPFVFLADSDW